MAKLTPVDHNPFQGAVRSPDGKKWRHINKGTTILKGKPQPGEPGEFIAYVDPLKVDAILSRDKEFYVGPGGEGGSTFKYKKAMEFLKSASEFNAPSLGVMEDGGVGFSDGRHRFAAMRDMGINPLPVAMDPQSLQFASRYGLLANSRPSDEASAGSSGAGA